MLITSADISLGDMNITISDLYNLHQSSDLTQHPHMHSDLEIHFAINGSALMSINETIYQLKRNNALIIPQNMTHYSPSYSQDYKTLAFCFSMKNNNNKKRTGEYDYYSSIFEVVHPIIVKLKAEERFFVNSLLDNLNARSMSAIHKINSLITILFINIGQNIAQITKNESPIVTSFPYNDITARKILIENYIYQNINHNITLTELSDTLSLSRRQTIRFIQQSFGSSFSDLITKACMMEAKNLMEEGQLNLTKIAQKLGYQNYSTFYAAYKRYYGITPQESLENIKNNTHANKL